MWFLRHNKIRSLLTFLFVLLLDFSLNSQCIYTDLDLGMEDDTLCYSIVVNGALNNNLANSDQGVCLVSLDFSYDFIDDIYIELTSPSGQSITLVGPNSGVGIITTATSWDIQFIPSSTAPSPDSGFSPTWNSLQSWGILGNYSGSYHPFTGNLEDFNIGPVNGTWTLKIVDSSPFGGGVLDGLGLIFCDPDGIECNECSIEAFDITIDNGLFCKGLADADLAFEEVVDTLDMSVYAKEYVIFEGDSIIARDISMDLNSLESGQYLVCGMVSAVVESDSLPQVTEKFGIDTLNQYFDNNFWCAQFSNTCHELTIVEQDTLIFNEAICLGDTILFEGVEYFDIGTYEIPIPGPVCDSIRILNLSLVDLNIELTTDDNLVNCGDTVTISAISNGEPLSNFLFEWSTTNGNIISDNTLPFIEVNSGGDYVVRIEEGSCIQIDTVSLEEDIDLPDILLEADTLRCDSNYVNILLSSNQNIDEVLWESDSAFIEIGNNIQTMSPGIYSVTVTAENGCQNFQQIEIIEDRYVPDYIYTLDTLGCRRDSVQIMGQIDDMSLVNSFMWLNIDPTYANDLSPYVFDAGTVSIIINGENGCSDTTNIEIIDNSYIPALGIVPDTITCYEPVASLEATYTTVLDSISWKFPDNSVQNSNPVSSSMTGMHEVFFRDTSGCENSVSYNLTIDTVTLQLLTTDRILTCGSDSIQLDFNASGPYDSVSWSSNFGFDSNEDSPWIFQTGTYELTVINSNGCSSLAEIEVEPDPFLMDFDFDIDTITCENTTATITALDTVGYVYTWNGPMIMDSVTKVLEVQVNGIYAATIQDTLNNCEATYEVEVITLIDYPEFSLSANDFDCGETEVVISMEDYDGIINTSVWDGPGILTTTDTTATVNLEGTYYLNLTNELGCESIDSITITLDDEIPDVSSQDTVITCGIDSVEILATSSDMGISFEWFFNEVLISNDPGTFVSEEGEYIVKVTGENNCFVFDTIQVTVDTIPPNLEIMSDGMILTCDDQNILLTAVTQVTGDYYWILGSDTIGMDQVIDINEEGMYYVIFETANQCSSIDSVLITSNQDFPNNVEITSDTIRCNSVESNIVVTIDGTYENLSWSGPEVILDNTIDATVQIAGVYTLELTTPNGCNQSIPHRVIGDTLPPDIIMINTELISCNTPTITADAEVTGENTVLTWSGPGIATTTDISVDINQTGTFLLSVEGENGCETSESFEIMADTLGPSIEVYTDTLNCSNGKGNVGFIAGATLDSIRWEGPNGFEAFNVDNVIVVDTGTYYIEVFDENMCRGVDSLILIADYSIPNIFVDEDFVVNCDSIPVRLSVESDIELEKARWFGPNSFFSEELNPFVIDTGTYLISATGLSDCFSDSIEVHVVYDGAPPEFSIIGDSITCIPDFAEVQLIDVSDDRMVEWFYEGNLVSNAQNLITKEDGIYKLVVTGTNGCKDSTLYNVVMDTLPPTVIIDQDLFVNCHDPLTVIDASQSSNGPNFSNIWTTSNGEIIAGETSLTPTINTTGLYQLEITNTRNNCMASDFIILDNPPTDLSGVVLEVIDPSCVEVRNGSIEVIDIVNGYYPYEVKFENQAFSTNPINEDLGTGSYFVQVKDSLGCIVDTTVVLGVGQDMNAMITGDTLIYLGDEANLFAGFDIPVGEIDSLRWNIDSLNCLDCFEVSVSPYHNTIYGFTAYSESGCIDSVFHLVRVDKDPRLDFPNIFSPNEDNMNDLFIYPTFPSVDRVVEFMIFDNWGSLIFEARDFDPLVSQIIWDGVFNGQRLNPGVFVYLNKVVLKDGREVVTKGDITLIR